MHGSLNVKLQWILWEIRRQSKESCDDSVLVGSVKTAINSQGIGWMRNCSYSKTVLSKLGQVYYWTVRHPNPHITSDTLRLCRNTWDTPQRAGWHSGYYTRGSRTKARDTHRQLGTLIIIPLHQWWANYGPRARYGPLKCSIRPARHYS